MAVTVLHFPPTASIHMTKDVTIVPPLETPKKNLVMRKIGNHGTRDEATPKMLCRMIQMTNTVFLPFLSASMPNIILPRNFKCQINSNNYTFFK